jgi:hypothetical protein
MALIRPIPTTSSAQMTAGIYHTDNTSADIVTRSDLSATTVAASQHGNLIIFDRSGTVTRSTQTPFYIIHSDGTWLKGSSGATPVIAGDIVFGNVGFTITLD